MILPEVIEEAAIAAHVNKLTGVRWSDLADWKRNNARQAASVAIKTAASHLMAAAWEEGRQAEEDSTPLSRPPQNPYGSPDGNA
jgi:hypothetical protein